MSRKKNPYRLANVELRAAKHSSFEIPPRQEREDLWPGDLAKLVFEDIGERLWVKVTDCSRWPCFAGVTVSSPLDNVVRRGDKVYFSPENVADVFNPEKFTMN